jgi:MATE family multidrug resistance protein
MNLVKLKAMLRKEILAFLRLAIPLAGTQVAQAMTSFVDTLMMGRLGQEALAAGGLAATTFFTVLMITSGAVMGVSPLIAEAFGAELGVNSQRRIQQVTVQSLWLAIALSVPIMLLLHPLDRVMNQVGLAADTIALADTYLNIILWGLFPAVGFSLLRGVVSALSQTQSLLYIVIAGTLFNILGNYLLGFGAWGFPRLELAGLAVASVITQWGMFTALVLVLLWNPSLKRYQILAKITGVRWNIIQELLHLGVPIAALHALEVSLFAVVTYLMGVVSTATLAAHQMVLMTIYMIFMVPVGMSYAATVRVGQLSGQGKLQGAQRAGYVSLGVGATFMGLMTIALLIGSKTVMALFLDLENPETAIVQKLALPMFTVAALTQVLDGSQKIAMGALYGLQDTQLPTLLSLSAFWLIGIPMSVYLCFSRGWGGVGLWLGQSLGIAIAAVVFVWRFHWLSCHKIKVRELPSRWHV